MSEFTAKDRDTQTKTLTLLEQHVKLSDERHDDVRSIIKDHEGRLRKNEGVIAKVVVITGFISAGITASFVAIGKKITG